MSETTHDTAAAAPHQISLVVSDDLRRSRITVFFRLLLAIPHFVWLYLWMVAAFLVAFLQWLVVLVRGVPAAGLHGFIARYIRYSVHVNAYVYLVADPFPPFGGKAGTYPVDVSLPGPERQGRLGAFFRLVLALPALMLNAALGHVLGAVALLGWFAALVVGRMPRGLHDSGAYALWYAAQANAYALLVTGRYPSADPQLVPTVRPQSPIRLRVMDDARRSRVTVFFRPLLVIPHQFWLSLWGIAVAVAAVANWFVALVTGQPAASLHSFVSRWLRYQVHVWSFLYLVANPFPGFGGQPGTYPVELELPGPAKQHRASIFFRTLLAWPALAVAGALGSALGVVALLSWFYSLVTGRAPLGLRNLAVAIVWVTVEVYAYVLLVRPRFPYVGVALREPSAAEPQTLAA